MPANEKTIPLSGQYVRQDRRVAAATLTPGELVEIDADDKWAAHSSAGGNAMPAFVLENELAGEGIDTDISADDQAPVGIFNTGAIVLAKLDSSSSNIVAGDPLESAGNGALKKHTPQAVDEGSTATYNINTDQIVAYAMDDETSPGSGTINIRVRIA